MEASVIRLVELLGDAKQYLVPLFQRPYSWERKEWQTLWDDLVELCEAENPRPHFFGAIVLIPARSIPEGVTKYSLIDGQQRYTTISVFFAALRRIAKERGEMRLADELYERFLINKFAEGNDFFKLLPTQGDRKVYRRIILGEPLNADNAGNADNPGNSRLAKAYCFFEKKIRSSQISLQKLKDVAERWLTVVRVLLHENEDPYLVFESLNAKGRPLSQADLIRNYFLMCLHTNHQEKIHKQYWQPMEDRLGEAHLAEFIRHYLIMRRGDFVKASEVYFVLKEYASGKDALEELQTLHTFSSYYARIISLESETNEEIRRAMHRLNRLQVTTAYPFLLACYDDYESQRLSAEDFLEVLRTLENFIIRRFVCGVPTNQLSKIFAPLSQQARELPVPFTEAVKDILEKRNYPKDFEFKRELVEAELYGAGDRGEKTKFILETLEESFGHKEQVAFDNLQVEHVMPQTLTDWWRSNLGENWKFTHETMCNTLGNLTLTAYNSELSNADFESKKRIYAGSHLELNRYFSEVETWREKDIRQRGEILAEKCLKIWSYFGKQNITNLDRQAEDEQVNTFETMNNGDFLVGEVLELFEALQDEVMRFNRAEEKILKQCVTYRVGNKTFLSVVPQKSGLKLYLNLPYEEVRNYTFCRDVTGIGHWGVGDVEVKIQEMQHIKEVMPIVRKAYERQLL